MKRVVETRREQAELFGEGVRAYKRFVGMADQKNAVTVTAALPEGYAKIQYAAEIEAMRQEYMRRHGTELWCCGTPSESQLAINSMTIEQRRRHDEWVERNPLARFAPRG